MLATTTLDASVTLPSLNNKQIGIHVIKGQNIKDLVHHLLQSHALPPYYSNSLYSTIISAMTETCQKELLYQHKHRQPDKKALRHLFLDAYQWNTLQYNNKPEEDIFPRAYHTLVHCPIASIFDTLLELEQNYAIAIQELQTASDHELLTIQARQAQEIESASGASTNSSTTGAGTSPQPSTSNNNRNSNTNSNMTSIFTRQIEEMEIFQATWQSDILQTQQTQRQEYREFVIELYREYQSRLASVSKDNTIAGAEKKLDGKEIVHAAAGRVRQWENNNTSNTENSILSGSDKSSTIASRPRTGSLASSLGSSPKQSVTEDEPSAVQIILELGLGFAKEQAESALVLSNHNVEAATELLLENPAKVDAYMAEQKLLQQQQQQQQQIVKPPTSSSTPYRRSHSLSQVPRPQFLPTTPPNGSIHSRQSSVTLQENRRHSLQRFGTTPTFFNIMSNKNSNNTTNNNNQNTPHNNINHAPNATTAVPTTTTSSGKSWNPISFLQQQKQAMENTNLSSVRKLGGWLGKAMENFGIDDEHQDGTQHKSRQSYLRQQSAPQLVESFTIMTGTAQIKCSHNLRLLVTDEATELFHPVYDSPREMAYRAETATKLYTSHLSAVIVLVEVSELTRKQGWRLYMTGKGSNKALMERCQQSTEFHFADMESQLTVIEKDFANGGLVEGSFFVTKHSNLPSTQVVYHLLIDSAAIASTDLSNRHPVIVGLRNILKMTTQFDISSLSIPLLFLPDRCMDQPDPSVADNSQWLQKRGEVVMKCINGFLIENSRSGKRVQNEGLDRAESMAGGGLRNVEFLLPSRPEVYTTASAQINPNTSTATAVTAAAIAAAATSVATSGSNSGSFSGTLPDLPSTPITATPQEVELAFQQFRTQLVSLFRAN